MNDDFSEGAKPVIAGLGKGGARIGAGRKKKYVTAKDKDAVELDEDIARRWMEMSSSDSKALKEKAEAFKTYTLARGHDFEYRVKTGEYLPRTAFREATATLLAMLAQRLRGLPDELERRCPLSPEILQRIEQVVDEILANAADDLAQYAEGQS